MHPPAATAHRGDGRFTGVMKLPSFDHAAVMAALDRQRIDRGLTWPALAEELHEQSSHLNAQLDGPGMCSGALVRTAKRDSMSCQYAMTLLRWLDSPTRGVPGGLRGRRRGVPPAESRTREPSAVGSAAALRRPQRAPSGAAANLGGAVGPAWLHARAADEPPHRPVGGHGPHHAHHAVAELPGRRLRPPRPVVRASLRPT